MTTERDPIVADPRERYRERAHALAERLALHLHPDEYMDDIAGALAAAYVDGERETWRLAADEVRRAGSVETSIYSTKLVVFLQTKFSELATSANDEPARRLDDASVSRLKRAKHFLTVARDRFAAGSHYRIAVDAFLAELGAL